MFSRGALPIPPINEALTPATEDGMAVDRKTRTHVRERQREAIRRLAADRGHPGRSIRPRGNQEAEPRDVERGMEKLGRVIGH
jgi:hypothetical protein